MTALADDHDLLHQYARTGDAEAYTQLVHRYIALVYGVCLRITRSHSDAEDVTQECLLDLARNAGEIRSSLPGYLHAVATRRSLMMRRSEGRRARRETAYVSSGAEPDPATATEITDAVDEAIRQLDDASRDLVVRRYLQGQSQQQIAVATGVDQSTISRKLSQAIEVMRDHLAGRGVGVSVVALTGALEQSMQVQPPAALIATAAKIGLSGVGRSAAKAAAPMSIKVTIVAVALAGATAVGYSLISGKGRQTMSGTAATAPVSTAAKTPRPDLRGIHLSGFGVVRDSVSVAFQAAAKALGKDADYERMYALSGNAFAPAINTGETCRSWWHVQARTGTGNLPAMAASVGLVAERLPLPAISESASEEQQQGQRKAAADLVLAAMDSGAVVVTEGGWDEVGGWVWSGVVTDVAADGTLRGAALSAATGDGKENVVWKYPCALWAIRSGNTSTATREVARAILTNAIDRIRGSGPYATRGTDRSGLAAMDQWIASMRDIRGFCPECFGRSPVTGVQDAPDNDKRMYEAAKVVARQLRAGVSVLPEGCKPYLEQAAVCYDRVAGLLEPGATGKGGFTWDSLASLEAQRRYASDVLEPVKRELDWAAAQLERALAIADGASLNAAVIPPYDALTRAFPDANPIRTNHLARVIAARAMGRDDVDYDDLVMLEGMGTTFAYDPKRFFLAYESPENPERTARYLVEGTGFDWEVVASPSPDEAWSLVKRCVDAQTPLVAYWLDDFLIAGYLDAPRAEDRRVYTMGRWSLGGWITWQEFAQQCQQFRRFAFPTGRPVAKVDMTRSVLERIVQYAKADPRVNVDFMKPARFGFDAMEAYAADIEDMSKGPGYFDGAWLACHALNRQWHGRDAAAKWLARAAQTQPAPAADHLRRASALYQQSHELWQQFRGLLTPEPGRKLEEKWTEVAPRQQGAKLVRQAIALEKHAATQVEQALAATP